MTLYRFDQIADNIRIPVMPEPGDSERYIGLEHMDSGSLRIRRWGAPTTLIGQKLTMKEGDVLFARRNAYLRRVAVAPFDGVFSAHGMVLRAKTDVCLHEFLPVFMESDYFMERAIKISVGSLSPTINWSTLAGEEFTLPPLDAQRRIAALLWAADETVQKQDELVNAALAVKKSFIEAMFSGSELREVGNYSQSVTSGSRWWAKFYSETGDVFVRVTNLTRETPRIDLMDLQYVTPPDGAEMERTKLQEGDLLISVTADLGRIGVVSEDFPRAFVSQHVALVRLRKDEVIPEFVAYFLLSSSGQSNFHKLNDVGAKAGMNLRNVKRLKFAWRPYEQQIQAMEKFRVFEEVVEAARRHLENQKRLKRKLLNEVFGG